MSDAEIIQADLEHAELFFAWGFLESMNKNANLFSAAENRQQIANLLDHIERHVPAIQAAKQREQERKAGAR